MANVTDTYYQGDAIHGYGSQLLVGQDNGSPETFVAIADIESITPGDMNTAVFLKTHLRSPEAHQEKKAGLRDSGPFQISGNWRPDHGTHSNAGGDGADLGLVGLWRTRAERNWQIKIYDDDGTTLLVTWPFSGVVTKFQPGAVNNEGGIKFTAEITPISDFSANLP